MNKLVKFIIVGIVIGIIDVIPMLIMKLSWDANISAFCMWVVVSIILYSNNMKLNHIVKSMVVAFLVLLPNAILIAWNNPINILPVVAMTTILSICMGLVTKRIN